MQLYGVETWMLYIFDIYLCELIKVECVVTKTVLLWRVFRPMMDVSKYLLKESATDCCEFAWKQLTICNDNGDDSNKDKEKD